MERNQAKKQNIWIPAEEIFNNKDLLTEILLRLQVKPLVRFKCVSKHWLSLISDPQFCLSHNRHHHHHHTPTALLLVDNSYTTPELEMVPLKQHTVPKVPFFNYLNAPSLCIMQSCNGLFLCSSKSNNQFQRVGRLFLPEYNYYICNPATKQFKILSFPSPEFKQSLVSVCMAFDPLKSYHYKLICIHTVEDEEKYRIDMYSSEKDSWSPLGITFPVPYPMNDAKPVYCNGIVHWFIEDQVETSVYFDVDRQCMKTMPVPNLAQREVLYFGESRGHLHLIVTESPTSLKFDVMEMAPNYSGWFVKYNVNLDSVRIALPDIIWYHELDYSFSVLHVTRAQKDEDSIVVIHVGDKAISYNVHDGTSKKLCDLETDALCTWRQCTDTFQYFEILTFV